MVNPENRKRYIPTIGIECHVQLKTRTKLFSAVPNDAREAPPNTLISHIDLGMPGALPVLNEKAVEYAVRAGFALGVAPETYSYFERKHYFYPDLPKGYQITQLSHPIVKGGSVTIYTNGESKSVRVNRIQIEEDAGKSTHPVGQDYSLVDLNRAGTPLLEIVSEADMHSSAEAKAYVKELYLLMKYANVSDANLYYGNMRFDVNVSVSKDRKKLGTRSETKNLNSFRSVEKAADYEINRQIELLEKGQPIIQETRGWDDAKQKTFSQRSKEDAHDYRYMPEPDIPPIELSKKYIDTIASHMPVMPSQYRKDLGKIGLSDSTVDILLLSPERSRFVKTIADEHGTEHAVRIANLMVNTLEQPSADEIQEDKVTMSVGAAVQLSEMLSNKQLSSTAGKEVWAKMSTSTQNPQTIAKRLNLIQLSDEAEIMEIVAGVLKDNAKAAQDVKNGEMKAIGFLVGQVMKQSKGQANPELAQKLIKQQLDI